MPTSTTKFLDVGVLDRVERTCGGTVSAKRAVKLDTDLGKVVQSAANDWSIGVAESDGTSGQSIQVALAGRVAMEAGGTVAAGDAIVADASGRGVARGTTATTLYHVLGHALTAAASGEHFTLQLNPYRVWGANAS